MKLPRFSLRTLVFAVVIFAADCAVLRIIGYLSGADTQMVLALFGVLPMANAIAIGLYRLAMRADSRRPFLIGFVFAGAVGAGAWVRFCLTMDDPSILNLLELLEKVAAHSPISPGSLSRSSSSGESVGFFVSFVSALVVLSASPQFAFGLFGGWLSGRIVLKRRVSEGDRGASAA
jgi:hypothetical protein